MMAMSSPLPESSGSRDRSRASPPLVAVGATLGAALAFAGIGAATVQLGGEASGHLAGAAVSLLAGLLALALVLSPATRTGALLLLWNALGIGCGLFVIGLFGVGALAIFPLALLGIALAAWPRRDGESIVSGPAIAVQLAGFLLVLLLTGVGGANTSDLWGGFSAIVGR